MPKTTYFEFGPSLRPTTISQYSEIVQIIHILPDADLRCSCHITLYPSDASLFPVRKLHVNIPDLFLHIHILHPRQPRCILTLRIPIIADRRLLPSRRLFLGQRLSRHAIKHVWPL